MIPTLPKQMAKQLSPKQCEITELLAIHHLNPKEIARKLCKSPHTIHAQLMRIRKKLAVRNNYALVALVWFWLEPGEREFRSWGTDAK